MKVHIIVDSTVDMAEHCRKQVQVVPLTVRFGTEEFIDGVTLDKRRFYEKLAESDQLPTTSQATPQDFYRLFQQVAEAGDAAVVITISAALSGTWQSACVAASEFENIYVVDSRSAAVGSGILAEYALNCASQGMSAPALAAHLEEKREDICLIALLDTLEYLQKGGRISKSVAFAGGLLQIKPVISFQEGQVVLVGKARGSRQGNNLLVQKIQESGGVDFSMPILLGYTGLTDALLQKYIEDSRQLWQPGTRALESTLVCSVIGTHIGPGAVAAAFFRKH